MIKAYRDYWKGYADFTGRTGVGGYWLAVLAHLLATFALSFVLGILGQRDSMQSVVTYLTAFGLLCVLPSLAILVRRLRDAGCSWTNLFWTFLPIAGPIILIVKLCKPSVAATRSNLSTGRPTGTELGPWRVPAAILLLWGTLTTVASFIPGIGLPAGAQVHLNVFWWLMRFSQIAFVVLLFIGSKNAALLIPSGLAFLLSLRGAMVYPSISGILSTAAWAVVCLVTAMAVFGKKSPLAFLLFLPAGLFLALGIYSLVATVTNRGFMLFDIVVLTDDALYAFGFFCLAKALAEKPRLRHTASASRGGALSRASQRPHASVGHSAQSRKNSGVLLVRFSIDKLNNLSGPYGFQSGRLIGQAVPAALLEGMTISDGDSAATLAGREYVCVVSIASDDISILTQKIEPLVQASKDIQENGAHPLTQVVGSTGEPLVADGVVRNGKVEGSGGWCANGLMSAWREAAGKSAEATSASNAAQKTNARITDNTGNKEHATVMANSAYQPKPKAGYGSDVFAILFSIFLIFGGASGQFVLRGTNSSTALVIAGFVFLAWDIFSVFRKRFNLKKAEEEYYVRSKKMQEKEDTVTSDGRTLPAHVDVRIACDKYLAALDLGPRLNGSAMTWDSKASEYTGSTSSVQNIVNFNNLDLTAVFEIAPHSGETIMELFRDKTEIGIALPGNVTLLPWAER